MKGKIGIVGSGLVGKSWAMIFASAGYNVTIYDIKEEAVENALVDIETQLLALKKSELLRGKLTPQEQKSLITGTISLGECIKDAFFIQSAIPENPDLKKKVFKTVADLVITDDVIISSSTSCLMPDIIYADSSRKEQSIICHPVNPPYYAPMVEIIPHDETTQDIRKRTRDIMAEVGQKPVLLNRAIDGFALNRIQYSVINESWRLVQDGIMSPEDVDTVLTAGLGMRYATIGPFETIHLNAEGVREYMEKFASSIKRVSAKFGPTPDYSGKALENICDMIEEKIPLGQMAKRRARRDKLLAGMAKLFKELDTDE